MSYDASFKTFFLELFKTYHIQATSSFKVGKLPLEIDLIFFHDKTHDLKSVWGPFESYAKDYDIVEIKSAFDKCPPGVYHKLRAYIALFWEMQEIPLNAEEQTTGWIIASKRPDWLTKALTLQQVIPIRTALYKFSTCWEIYLVVINELPLEPLYYPFLAFSSGDHLRSFIKAVFLANNKVFKSLLYLLYWKLVNQMSEAEEIPFQDPDDNIREAIHHLGVKHVIHLLGLKEVLDAVGLKEVVDAVGLKEVLTVSGLKDVIGTAEFEKLLKKLD